VAESILRYDVHGYSKLTYREALDQRMVKAVTDAARSVCIQQALLMRQEIKEATDAADRLAAMTSSIPAIIKQKKTKSNVKTPAKRTKKNKEASTK